MHHDVIHVYRSHLGFLLRHEYHAGEEVFDAIESTTKRIRTRCHETTRDLRSLRSNLVEVEVDLATSILRVFTPVFKERRHQYVERGSPTLDRVFDYVGLRLFGTRSDRRNLGYVMLLN